MDRPNFKDYSIYGIAIELDKYADQLEAQRDKAVSLLEEFTEADGNIELEKIYYKCIRFLKNNVRKQ